MLIKLVLLSMQTVLISTQTFSKLMLICCFNLRNLFAVFSFSVFQVSVLLYLLLLFVFFYADIFFPFGFSEAFS